MSKDSGVMSAEEKIIKGLQGFAEALKAGEDVTQKFTCRKVVLNLEPVFCTPEKIKKVRKTLGLSQTLFAQFIGASVSTVQAWERGEREPSPMACRFIDEIMEDPQRFRDRFIKLSTPAESH